MEKTATASLEQLLNSHVELFDLRQKAFGNDLRSFCPNFAQREDWRQIIPAELHDEAVSTLASSLHVLKELREYLLASVLTEQPEIQEGLAYFKGMMGGEIRFSGEPPSSVSALVREGLAEFYPDYSAHELTSMGFKALSLIS